MPASPPALMFGPYPIALQECRTFLGTDLDPTAKHFEEQEAGHVGVDSLY